MGGGCVCIPTPLILPPVIEPALLVERLARAPRLIGLPGTSHELFGEQVSRPSSPIRAVTRIRLPVPIMQSDRWVYLLQQRFESVDKLSVPGQEGWTFVDVGGLGYLIMLEPVRHQILVLFLIDREDGVSQLDPLGLAHHGHVSADRLLRDDRTHLQTLRK